EGQGRDVDLGYGRPCLGTGRRDQRGQYGRRKLVPGRDRRRAVTGMPRVPPAPVKYLAEPTVPADASFRYCRLCSFVPKRHRNLFIPARKQHVNALTHFSLNQTAAASGSLEFNGDALVSGTQVTQSVNSIQINLHVSRKIGEHGNDIVDSGE